MSKGKRNREKRTDKVATYTFTAEQVAKMREESRKAGWSAARENIKETIETETAKMVDQFCRHYDVHVLYILHACYGWGYKRLHDFYEEFAKEHERLKQRYEQHDIGNYVAEETLKGMGIDLDAWFDEMSERMCK